MNNQISLIVIKIYAASVFAFIVLSDLPVLAGRISQLLGVTEVVAVPFIIYIFRPKYAAAAMVVVFALLIFYKQLYFSDLMFPYFN